ncbi:MAG: DUF188 domain-containing protein [Clostridia bacterium]|nr:DUF188 domain-containing protein [Clostridia bacterium]
MNVLIDGDGYPVIGKTITICKERDIPVIVFIDTSHVLRDDYARVVIVDKGNDAVDFAIVNQIQPKDIVITQDYGLASMALAKRAKAINQNGLVYDENNIDSLLASRHMAKMARREGSYRFKGPKKRMESDNKGFAESFIRLIENEN